MFFDLIGILALLFVHLGFSALLGLFARQAKTASDWAMVLLAGLVYLGSSQGFPFGGLPRLGLLLASATLVAYVAKVPVPSAGSGRLAWSYAGFAMLLISIWSAAQGWFSPALALGAAAAWAGILAWRRGLGLSANR